MVRCFLVHTVCSISSVGAVDSRVIYSRAFGPDESITSVQNREFGPEERRLLQREKLAVLASSIVIVYKVLLKSDRLDVLLSRLLPHGQLLFLNHRFAQSLEKDIMLYMAK
ncbi:AP-5 complex subunit sigma-1 [Thalassophryne amazonica]|uniref:AP-5 complex subunit sigma-1 n=1 Tax=Thalassophryne amazonica TaxID=390379 RepID=UPI001471FD9E|nr:AP-5 complex subunit sigma-1 [Thalassophryne amazonica]